MENKDIKTRILAANKLLTEETTTREKFEAIRALIKGINPRLDKTLEASSKALSDLEKVQKGDFVQLSAEALPEETEEEKKRKRAILLFIKSWKDLQSEVERVRMELGKEGQTPAEQVSSMARIISLVKGPFGIITIAAVVIVGVSLFLSSPKNLPSRVSPTQTPSVQKSPKPKIQVIEFQGKKIPLSEIEERSGPDCDSPHYHAKDHTAAKALDGSTVSDPGACGFGRVRETIIKEVEAN